MDEEHYSRGKVRECMRTLTRRRGSKGHGSTSMQIPSSRRGRNGARRNNGSDARNASSTRENTSSKRGSPFGGPTLRLSSMRNDHGSSRVPLSSERKLTASRHGRRDGRQGEIITDGETEPRTEKLKIDELPSSRKTRQWPGDYISWSPEQNKKKNPVSTPLLCYFDSETERSL